MNLWNYIGEFFLFRWLFGKLFHKRDNNGSIVSSNQSLVEDNSVDISSINHYSQGYSAHNYLKDSQQGSNYDKRLLDPELEEDEYLDDLDFDDLDYFDRNFANDFEDRSFNNFHEEQDDYDMFDDF